MDGHGTGSSRKYRTAQLNDTSKVTDEQKVALKKNRDEYTEQKRKLIQAMREYGRQEDIASAALWEQLDVSGDQNFSDLYSGRITWGEYNRRRNELAEEFRKKNREIRKSKYTTFLPTAQKADVRLFI